MILGKFDIFWEELALYLDSSSVPDDQRHGTGLHRPPNTNSIEVIRKKMINILESKQDNLPQIPCNE